MEEKGRQGQWPTNPTLGDYVAVIGNAWWKIALLSVAAGVVTFLLMLARPDVYRASATIAPMVEDKKQNQVLGTLASFGVNLGASSKIEDLEAQFRSNYLTVRIFRKYDVWPHILLGKYDPETKSKKADWRDRLFEGRNGLIKLGDWDAVRAVKDRLKVMVNRKLGTITLIFECNSPGGAAAIVGYYLEEGKNRLQEEAFDRANSNKRFIAEQIDKTHDILTKDRLYTLYSQEIEREMLARNRQQFGFTLIDPPMVPDKKTRPHRLLVAVQVTVVSLLLFSFFFLYRARVRKTVSPVK